MNDSTWTSGGIGYDAYLASSGGTVYFDDITNKSADGGGGDDGGTTDTNIIDDFEDGNLDEYQHDTSRSGRASIVSSPTLSGSHALAISNENAELISTSGLGTYPSQGEIFNYWVRATGGADQINLTYGVQDHTNRYFVRVDFDDDWLMAFEFENSEYTQIAEATSGFVIPEDQLLRVEIYWQRDGTHEITLFDSGGNVLSRISGTDSTWTDGGIGYDAYLASSGGSVYFDSVYRYRPDYTPNNGPVVIDDFEDGDLSEWSKVEESDNAEIVSNPTKDGSDYSLKLTGNVTIRSTSGLSNYPTAGDTFSYWVRLKSDSGIEDNPDGGIAFEYGGRYDDGSYGYAVYLFYGSSSLELHKWEDSNTKLAESSTSSEVKFDEWYRIEINWGLMGHHWISLYDLAGILLTRIHGTDNTFKVGRIAMWPNTSTSGVGGLIISIR
jgi:hypothetical protein